MTKKIPWKEIKTPDQDYNVRKIARETKAEMYWGKDVEGHCLLLIRMWGNLATQFHKEKVTARGISTDLRLIDSIGTQFFVLRLEREIDIDLFFALCDAMIDAVGPIDDPKVLLNIIFGHLRRWKAFLAGRILRILSVEEQRGLFCEIRYIQSLLDGTLSQKESIGAWRGPYRQQQDFIYFDRAVEIKSLYGNTRNAIHISSEDQLETTCPKLFLSVYRLAEQSPSDRALSLNDLVRKVYSSLIDDEAIDMFSEKLAAAGYVELKEYNSPTLIVTGINVYRIEENFPRITRSSLPSAILKVSYDLQLHEISKYQCPANELMEKPA